MRRLPKFLRSAFITLFVVMWMLVFHYESIRYFYLNSYFGKELPKLPYLFPPAGWIMFYHVDDQFSHVEVYGVKGEESHFIDPHDIFRTRTIGFDNIHRNILGGVASRARAIPFCRFLKYRFPYYDRFVVTAVIYPSLTKEPEKRRRQVQYQCLANENLVTR